MIPRDPRSSSLVQVNSMLREQLEQANVANAALSEDIRKLTADWARARDELEQREEEWRREEEVGTARAGTGILQEQQRGEGCEAGGMWGHGEGCGIMGDAAKSRIWGLRGWHVMGRECKAEGWGMWGR